MESPNKLYIKMNWLQEFKPAEKILWRILYHILLPINFDFLLYKDKQRKTRRNFGGFFQ